MDFWKLNWLKLLSKFVIFTMLNLLLFGKSIPLLVVQFSFLSFMFFAGFVVPAINSFRVVSKTIQEGSEFFITPIIDAHYELIGLNKKNIFLFTTLGLKGTIDDLPFIISYSPKGKGTPAEIVVTFKPLSKEDSRRIYSEPISFPLTWSLHLKKDIKPEILAFVTSLKQKRYTSGVNRPLSTKHIDAYA